MSRKTRTISLPEDLDEWIEENPHIILSQIVQETLRHQRELQNQSAQYGENKAIRERLEAVMNQLKKRVDFIEKKGLTDEYLKEVEGI